MASAADVAIGAGDFANVRRNLSACLNVLRNMPCPVVMVAGNNETTNELIDECQGWRDAHVLHGSSVTLAGMTFFGLGGGVPVTPFGSWSYDLTEVEAAVLLSPAPVGCVLVSHSPPKGYCDQSSRGQSLGSTAVLETIKRCRPSLVVCGHIHGSARKVAHLGVSQIINAGPSGMLVDL